MGGLLPPSKRWGLFPPQICPSCYLSPAGYLRLDPTVFPKGGAIGFTHKVQSGCAGCDRSSAESLTRAAAKPRLPGPPQDRALSYPHAKQGFPIPSSHPHHQTVGQTPPPRPKAPRGSSPRGPYLKPRQSVHCPSTFAPVRPVPTLSPRWRWRYLSGLPGGACSNAGPASRPSSGARRLAAPPPRGERIPVPRFVRRLGPFRIRRVGSDDRRFAGPHTPH